MIIVGIELTHEIRRLLGSLDISYPSTKQYVEFIELITDLSKVTKRIINTPNQPHDDWVQLESVLRALVGNRKEPVFRRFLMEL